MSEKHPAGEIEGPGGERLEQDAGWSLFDRYPAPRVDEQLRLRVLAQIQAQLHAEHPGRPLGQYLRFALRYGLAAAAMILLAIGLMLVFSPRPRQQPVLLSGESVPHSDNGQQASSTLDADPLAEELELLEEQVAELEVAWSDAAADELQWDPSLDRLDGSLEDPIGSAPTSSDDV